MEKAPFLKRFIMPVVIMLAIMAITSTVYFRITWRIDNTTLKGILALASAAMLFASIGFGSLYIYPRAFFMGAGAGERIIACLITPLVWNIKEMIRVSECFTPGETLYYGLNTTFLLSIFGGFGLMGLCELICRWRLNKRTEERIKIFSPIPVISILAGVAALYVCLLWGMGVHFFYIYIQGYRILFA